MLVFLFPVICDWIFLFPVICDGHPPIPPPSMSAGWGEESGDRGLGSISKYPDQPGRDQGHRVRQQGKTKKTHHSCCQDHCNAVRITIMLSGSLECCQDHYKLSGSL